MSSFTIAKQEYMKAAGLVAGIAETMRDFWIYDYENHRKSTKEDYRRRFTECYEMNALSVQMQYNDHEPETDTETYEKDFSEHFNLGKQLVYNGGMVLRDAALELNDFFRSAIYQTEYEPYMWKMSIFFDRIISELFSKMNPHECNSWGSLEITPPTHKYQAII